MKNLLAVSFCVIAFSFHVMSQSRTITGKVTDINGAPLQGASVSAGKLGTSTTAEGEFSLSVPSSVKKITVSLVGYRPREADLQGQEQLTIVMESDAEKLDEVIVTAMGIERKNKSVGYALSTLKSEDILKAREVNLVNALAGKVSGVRVTSQSGTLGGSAKIIIRGASSIDGSNQPLIVIDGLPVDNGAPGFSLNNVVAGQIDFGNRGGDINPDDIENVTILKGASATALYGSRAKNGAVIITTKKGKKGQMTILVNSSVRAERPLKLPELQNEYAQGDRGVYDVKNLNGWGPKIADMKGRMVKDFLGRDVELQAYPDNLKNFYETGLSYINNVSLAGGSEGSDYRVSMSATNQTGTVPNTKFNKYSVGINSGRDFTSYFSARTSVNYIKISSAGKPAQASNDPNVLAIAINNIPRTVNINDVKENYLDPVTGKQVPVAPATNPANNPYWILNNNIASSDIDRLIGNLVLTAKPLKWLTISNNFGTDFYTDYRRRITRKGTFGALDGQFIIDQYVSRVINNDLIFTINKNITSDLELKFLAGNNFNQRELKQNSNTSTTLTLDNLYTAANAASNSPVNTSNKRALIGVFGDLTLGYRNLLFLGGSLRNDWSSTLPKSNRSYMYPSGTLSFIFSDLLHWDVLNYGKFRMAAAGVGSDEAPYQLDFTYTPANTYYVQYGLNGNFPHGQYLAFYGPQILPPLNLQPQKQTSYETGFDLQFFKSRIGFSVTVYKSITKNQIVNIDVPLSTGYFAKKVNAAQVSNRGIEADLNLKPLSDFHGLSWSVDVNFSANEQTVDEISGDLKVYNLQSGYSGLQVRAERGKSFGIYGSAWKRDPAGNFIIDAATGYRQSVNNSRLGSIYPDWTLGVNNTFSYKGFTLSGLVDVRSGGVMFSGTVANLRANGVAKETAVNREGRFIDKGVNDLGNGRFQENVTPVESMQQWWTDVYSNTLFTESSVYDASYVKLREVRLSYALSSSGVPRWLKALEVGLEGRNLLLIKSYVPHIDPESNVFGPVGNGEGVEFYSVPSSRSIGANLRLQF